MRSKSEGLALSGKKGFTLIELLVVISIIALLGSVALVGLKNSRARARDTKRVGDMNQLAKALEMYFSENSRYPTSVASIGAGAVFSSSTAPGLGKFIAAFPQSPNPAETGCTGSGDGGNVYWYRSDTTGSKYTITFCLGDTNPGNIGTGIRYLTPGGFR